MLACIVTRKKDAYKRIGCLDSLRSMGCFANDMSECEITQVEYFYDDEYSHLHPIWCRGANLLSVSLLFLSYTLPIK